MQGEVENIFAYENKSENVSSLSPSFMSGMPPAEWRSHVLSPCYKQEAKVS